MVLIVREETCAVRFCGDDFDGPEIPLTDLPVGATVAHIVACLSDEDAELEFVSPKSPDFGKQLNANKLNVVAKAFSERAQLKEKYQVPTRRSNLLDAAFETHFPAAVSSRLDGHCANALITGPAKSAKSSLFNALFCLCNGSELDVMPRSTNETDKTAKTYRREKCSTYLQKWDALRQGDVVLIDGVPYKGACDDDELLAAGQGLLADTEAFPILTGTTMQAKVAHRAAVELVMKRDADPTRHVCCIFNCIAAQQVMSGDEKVIESFKSVIQKAKDLFTTGDKNDPIEIAVFTVITRVDEYLGEEFELDHLVDQRKHEETKAIIKKGHECLGVAEHSITLVAELNKTNDIDFADTTTDPRALVLRHLLLRAAGAGELFARRFGEQESS